MFLHPRLAHRVRKLSDDTSQKVTTEPSLSLLSETANQLQRKFASFLQEKGVSDTATKIEILDVPLRKLTFSTHTRSPPVLGKFSMKIRQTKNKILNNIKESIWKLNSAARIEISLDTARKNLRKLEIKPTYLVDNSLIGNATTHKTTWVSTGTSLWGGAVPVETGYECRFPLYSEDSEEKLYKETEFLVGLTILAREGLINFVTSAELFQERMRQPRGRYIGHKTDDVNLFRGINMQSIDGYLFEPKDSEQKQNARINKCTEIEFLKIKKILSNGGTGNKTTFDAWHIHTSQKHNLSGFLTMDFKLVKSINRETSRSGIFSRAPALLPSDVAREIKLAPIKPIWITHQDVTWFARHDTSIEELKNSRNADSQKNDINKKGRGSSMTDKLAIADDIMGILVDTQMSCINVQYADANKEIHEISMDLPNAMYLLSLLKSVQLNLDIPFPDDPRDPHSPVLRPSDRLRSKEATKGA